MEIWANPYTATVAANENTLNGDGWLRAYFYDHKLTGVRAGISARMIDLAAAADPIILIHTAEPPRACPGQDRNSAYLKLIKARGF